MSESPLVFLILVLAIDFVVDGLWSNLNAHTSYVGWSMAVTFAYQHLIPLGVSTGLGGVIAEKG